jgi:hypothetical protein
VCILFSSASLWLKNDIQSSEPMAPKNHGFPIDGKVVDEKIEDGFDSLQYAGRE